MGPTLTARLDKHVLTCIWKIIASVITSLMLLWHTSMANSISNYKMPDEWQEQFLELLFTPTKSVLWGVMLGLVSRCRRSCVSDSLVAQIPFDTVASLVLLDYYHGCGYEKGENQTASTHYTPRRGHHRDIVLLQVVYDILVGAILTWHITYFFNSIDPLLRTCDYKPHDSSIDLHHPDMTISFETSCECINMDLLTSGSFAVISSAVLLFLHTWHLLYRIFDVFMDGLPSYSGRPLEDMLAVGSVHGQSSAVGIQGHVRLKMRARPHTLG